MFPNHGLSDSLFGVNWVMLGELLSVLVAFWF